ncbi:unnamed protein product [Acanthoscelides obtectus]|uniref:Uncharacterized protein n=1 Tax=Acanthoscelides obtectus TaxID=200917 RepID=A0A9P0KTA8_ACAOB|nr:unnamed protein product [Acanthoscelides obtectus]CAK1631921.1 hypothetical protein AOBTE_LOCUS7238 [Acanthoscelides obtectus]
MTFVVWHAPPHCKNLVEFDLKDKALAVDGDATLFPKKVITNDVDAPNMCVKMNYVKNNTSFYKNQEHK